MLDSLQSREGMKMVQDLLSYKLTKETCLQLVLQNFKKDVCLFNSTGLCKVVQEE